MVDGETVNQDISDIKIVDKLTSKDITKKRFSRKIYRRYVIFGLWRIFVILLFVVCGLFSLYQAFNVSNKQDTMIPISIQLPLNLTEKSLVVTKHDLLKPNGDIKDQADYIDDKNDEEDITLIEAKGLVAIPPLTISKTPLKESFSIKEVLVKNSIAVSELTKKDVNTEFKTEKKKEEKQKHQQQQQQKEEEEEEMNKRLFAQRATLIFPFIFSTQLVEAFLSPTVVNEKSELILPPSSVAVIPSVVETSSSSSSLAQFSTFPSLLFKPYNPSDVDEPSSSELQPVISPSISLDAPSDELYPEGMPNMLWYWALDMKLLIIFGISSYLALPWKTIPLTIFDVLLEIHLIIYGASLLILTAYSFFTTI